MKVVTLDILMQVNHRKLLKISVLGLFVLSPFLIGWGVWGFFNSSPLLSKRIVWANDPIYVAKWTIAGDLDRSKVLIGWSPPQVDQLLNNCYNGKMLDGTTFKEYEITPRLPIMVVSEVKFTVYFKNDRVYRTELYENY